MKNVISLAAYKADKGIVPPGSPYYTSNATSEQISEAVERANAEFSNTMDYRGKPPYAVVIGYEDKKGHVRLLKNLICYPTKHSFEMLAGKATMCTVALVRDNGL